MPKYSISFSSFQTKQSKNQSGLGIYLDSPEGCVFFFFGLKANCCEPLLAFPVLSRSLRLCFPPFALRLTVALYCFLSHISLPYLCFAAISYIVDCARARACVWNFSSTTWGATNVQKRRMDEGIQHSEISWFLRIWLRAIDLLMMKTCYNSLSIFSSVWKGGGVSFFFPPEHFREVRTH